ncbi:MAG: hypothetical protein RLZZ479_373 [Bacteroidota bacterium]|jgi:peptide methionine sulfoxide reductase MsrA
MLLYKDFLAEGKKGTNLSGRVMKTNSPQEVSVNHSDETVEGFRRKLLDVYFAKTDDKQARNTINKCISTYVYALDKKLRISSDIVEMLADSVGETVKETIKTLTEETKKYFGNEDNHYGTTA